MSVTKMWTYFCFYYISLLTLCMLYFMSGYKPIGYNIWTIDHVIRGENLRTRMCVPHLCIFLLLIGWPHRRFTRPESALSVSIACCADIDPTAWSNNFLCDSCQHGILSTQRLPFPLHWTRCKNTVQLIVWTVWSLISKWHICLVTDN